MVAQRSVDVLGVFLIDLKPDPVHGNPLSQDVPDRISRIRDLEPSDDGLRRLPITPLMTTVPSDATDR